VRTVVHEELVAWRKALRPARIARETSRILQRQLARERERLGR
jgi:hypothetical protein